MSLPPGLLVVALLALAVLAGAALSAAGEEGEPTQPLFFVALYRPGPNWLAGKPVLQQPLAEHGAYMAELHAAGTLLEGGPFLDHTGGISLFRVASASEMRAILEKDPAITSGVMEAELKPWMRVDWQAFRARIEDEAADPGED